MRCMKEREGLFMTYGWSLNTVCCGLLFLLEEYDSKRNWTSYMVSRAHLIFFLLFVSYALEGHKLHKIPLEGKKCM